MEIHRLCISLTEKALNDLANKHFPEEVAVEDLEIRILPEGVRVKGAYQMFVPVTFEALWELGVEGGRATARLAHFRTMGIPANVLKSLIMNVIADAARKEPWLQVQGDLVRADLDGMLKRGGLQGRTNLTAIRCQIGVIVVEAGNGEPPK
jgi:hypothetical protein